MPARFAHGPVWIDDLLDRPRRRRAPRESRRLGK
jgi:hypothetical protein